MSYPPLPPPPPNTLLLTIATPPCHHIAADGRNVAFGRVLTGMDVVTRMAGSFAVSFKPATPIVIKAAGRLVEGSPEWAAVDKGVAAAAAAADKAAAAAAVAADKAAAAAGAGGGVKKAGKAAAILAAA